MPGVVRPGADHQGDRGPALPLGGDGDAPSGECRPQARRPQSRPGGGAGGALPLPGRPALSLFILSRALKRRGWDPCEAPERERVGQAAPATQPFEVLQSLTVSSVIFWFCTAVSRM